MADLKELLARQQFAGKDVDAQLARERMRLAEALMQSRGPLDYSVTTDFGMRSFADPYRIDMKPEIPPLAKAIAQSEPVPLGQQVKDIGANLFAGTAGMAGDIQQMLGLPSPFMTSDDIVQALGANENELAMLMAPGPPTFIGTKSLDKVLDQLNRVDGMIKQADAKFFQDFGFRWQDAPDPTKPGMKGLLQEIYFKKNPGVADTEVVENFAKSYADQYDNLDVLNRNRVDLASQGTKIEQLNQLDPTTLPKFNRGVDMDLVEAVAKHDPRVTNLIPTEVLKKTD